MSFNNSLLQFMKNKLGITLFILSFILWIPIAAVPFMKMSTAVSAAIIVFLITVEEILFWVGSILIGKDIIKKYNPLHILGKRIVFFRVSKRKYKYKRQRI